MSGKRHNHFHLPPPGKLSWEGLEEQRLKLINAAEAARDADALVDTVVSSSMEATAAIIEAMKDLSTARNKEIRAAAETQLTLAAVQAEMRDSYGLDWDFVHCETIAILEPTEEQNKIARNLMEAAKKRAAREAAKKKDRVETSEKK